MNIKQKAQDIFIYIIYNYIYIYIYIHVYIYTLNPAIIGMLLLWVKIQTRQSFDSKEFGKCHFEEYSTRIIIILIIYSSYFLEVLVEL